MAVPFSNTKLRVPHGFPNILEGLSREVLRNQPTDIYAFGALYMENLLQVRAASGWDPAEIGAKHEDRFYNDTSFSKKEMELLTDKDKISAALKIQTKYRQYMAKKSVIRMKEDIAALKIQSVYRGHMDREVVQEMKSQSKELVCEAEEEEDKEKPVESPVDAYGSRAEANEQSTSAVSPENEKMKEEENITEEAATRIQADEQEVEKVEGNERHTGTPGEDLNVSSSPVEELKD